MFGCTTGCTECRTTKKDTTATNHSEECRRGLQNWRKLVMRLVCETDRLLEYLEEERKKKKAKASENSGDTKAGASPSGPATSEGEAPRNRG